MRITWVAGAIAALGAIGCGGVAGPPASYELRLDPNMTPEQATLVLGVYDDWRAQAGARTDAVVSAEACHYHDGDSAGCIHVRYGTVSEASAACPGTMPGYERAGCTLTASVNGYPWEAEIVLTDSGDFTLNHEIAEHEAGHSFGLHHDITGTLMAPTEDTGYPDITERDIAQFHKVQGR